MIRVIEIDQENLAQHSTVGSNAPMREPNNISTNGLAENSAIQFIDADREGR
jgi:hypothetical protein